MKITVMQVNNELASTGVSVYVLSLIHNLTLPTIDSV